MGYHKNSITKGQVGDWTKIREEYEEFIDAVEDEDPILQLCEMADLIGAIAMYSRQRFGIGLEDVIKFSDKTAEAFQEGSR